MTESKGDSPMSPPALESSLIKRKHPCVLCQQRKVKCDRNDPCANCTKARVQCISTSTMPPKRRKKRFPEAELLARLRRYEYHLKNYGADIEAINQETSPLPKDNSPKVLHVDNGERTLAIRRSLKNVESNLWSDVADDFQDAQDLLRASSDDEDFQNPIIQTYDALTSDGSDLLFHTEIARDLSSLHPSPMHIFRLWQTFLDNVNPLTKIIHAPTVQQQILDASGNLEEVPKKTQVLMFGIYSMAVNSLTNEECISLLGEEKNALLAKYRNGARQALLQASFLRSSDLTVLQGFTLYLMSCLTFLIDPRALFILTGMAIRMAQRIGLNFDGTTYQLKPFEIEMRRRLWWQIIFLDSRVGEMSGNGPSVLQHMWTTRLPLNVNDSDLFPDMKDPPVEHPGITEMVFVLQRCEIIETLTKAKKATGSARVEDDYIAALEARLEEKYLRHCDPQIPLHYISAVTAQIGIARLKVGSRQPNLFHSKDVVLPGHQRDMLFELCLFQLEKHHELVTAEQLNKFHWYMLKNFPFPSQIYVLCELRNRPIGALADRAWDFLPNAYEHRAIIHGDKKFQKPISYIFLAVANLTVKAWEAREAALLPFRPSVPPSIQKLREHLQDHRSSKSTPATQSESSPSTNLESYTEQSSDAYMWINQPPINPDLTFDPLPPMQNGMQTEDAMNWTFWNDYMQVPGTAPAFEFSGNVQGHSQF
ncbi:fungal-specific transcription factor domain-containing protein [Tricladium varicosporioides]|nr:fungal-specific transcription factor domain-containing protein [Hymenoscyphus varicosporioides]